MEEIIRQTGVADRIHEERWRQGFMDELRILSKNLAMEIDKSELKVNKGTYKLQLEEWVHARVLLMILILAAWMKPQWSTHFNGKEEDFVELVKQAFNSNGQST